MKKSREINNPLKNLFSKTVDGILETLKLIYIKLFKINDTPQRIALGLGMGVSLGIIPGTGPIAALFLAWVFRLNRVSALLGSLLTNTWLSIVTFLLSVKTGSAIMKINWQDTQRSWLLFIKDFNWQDLFKLSILRIILPVIVGYLVVSFFLGFIVYLISWIVIKRIKYEDKDRGNISQ